ncbi:hypothetical protein, partial [Clostridium haemolyticum]|uniref:hypothetical protein n=1 Tax=Clostridium haemolyticum TaxID=84025 RepID=UPI00195C8F9D
KVKVLSLGIITSLFMSSTPVLAATNFQSNTEKIYNSQVNKISNFKVKNLKLSIIITHIKLLHKT